MDDPQNNSNYDLEQENQHHRNFIFPAVNSDNDTEGKESGKAGDSSDEPAEKVKVKARDVNPSEKKKVLKQKKKYRKKNRVHPQVHNLRKLKGKEEKRSGQKRRKLPSSSNVSSSYSTTDSYQESEASAKNTRCLYLVFKNAK